MEEFTIRKTWAGHLLRRYLEVNAPTRLRFNTEEVVEGRHIVRARVLEACSMDVRLHLLGVGWSVSGREAEESWEIWANQDG